METELTDVMKKALVWLEQNSSTFVRFYRKIEGKKEKNFIEYRCEFGHENDKCVSQVGRKGCKKCGNNKKRNSINVALQIASTKNGKFLSDGYDNNYTNYTWSCEIEGHPTFEMSYHAVYQGHWCPLCSREASKNTIDDAIKLAEQNNGKFLSTEYIGNKETYDWQCEYGHVFKMIYCNVVSGSWCQECGASLYERTCRSIMEYIFGLAFVKIRPKFLKNPETEKNLELDIYNDDMKLAVEYNGIQHYEYKEHWHRSIEEFEALKRRDELKKKLCEENGVFLIIVPHHIKYKDLYGYLWNKLKEEDYLPEETEENIDYKELKLLGSCAQRIKEIDDYLQERFGGGRIISTYIDCDTETEFECMNGHTFKRTFHGIQKSAHFCPMCKNDKRVETKIKIINSLCQEFNYVFLDTYINAHTNYRWKCNGCDGIRTCRVDYIKERPICQGCKI